MNDGHWLADSPLSQKVTRDGMTIEVLIYRAPDDSGWTLEVIDQENGATVWDHPFATDQAALDEVLRTIAREGIASFLAAPPQPSG